YILWPAATPILETRVDRKIPPRTGQKGINNNPLFTVYKRIGPCHFGNIFPLDLNDRGEKVATEIDPAFNLICRLPRPILF
ncbi:MAG: hypothetical protein V7749_17670, partial [Cocleimonas sp.]